MVLKIFSYKHSKRNVHKTVKEHKHQHVVLRFDGPKLRTADSRNSSAIYESNQAWYLKHINHCWSLKTHYLGESKYRPLIWWQNMTILILDILFFKALINYQSIFTYLYEWCLQWSLNIEMRSILSRKRKFETTKTSFQDTQCIFITCLDVMLAYYACAWIAQLA